MAIEVNPISPTEFSPAFSPMNELLMRDLASQREGTPIPQEGKTALYEGLTSLMQTLGIPEMTDKQRHVLYRSGIRSEDEMPGEQIAFLLQYLAYRLEPSLEKNSK